MINAIILTAIIVVIIYIFTFRRIKRNKAKTFDSVKEYHESYIEKQGLTHYKEQLNSNRFNALNNFTIYSADSGNQSRTNYVTKYNSNEDYRE